MVTETQSKQDKKAFNFELVSPAKMEIISREEKVVIPGSDGDFMVLPGHTRLITDLRNGVLRVIRGEQDAHVIYITGGFADVGPDHCTVLAAEAIPVHKLNPEELNERLKILTGDLEEKKEDGREEIDQEIGAINRKLEILKNLKNS